MKKFFIVFAFMSTTSLFANTIKFECKLKDIDGVHKFDARGVVVVNDNNELTGTISMETKKALENQSIQVFEQMPITGILKNFEPGSITTKGFNQLALKVENSYIKNIYINLDIGIALASYASTIDNFLYRSNCYNVIE